MIEGLVVDSYRLKDHYAAQDDLGNFTSFKSEKKPLAYKSETVNKLGLYTFRSNLVGAKRFFLDNMDRQEKIIYGNSFYHSFKRGIYTDVVYHDFRSYYVKIFEQICRHIDEQYFGKEIKSLAKRNIALRDMKKNGVMFSNEALKKPLVDIDDIARNGIKLDTNESKEGILRMINSLSNADFVDEADKRVAKITRNALVYGFGYQQKNARINNICALVMFFAKELMDRTVKEVLNITGEKVVFAHTDSVMSPYLHERDLDQAIRTACGLIDAKYFGNTEVIAMGLNNITVKGKFEELLILNQNSYVASTIASQGRRDIQLKIAGLNTLSECGLGIDRRGESIQDYLFNSISDVFSWNQVKGDEREYLYSVLKYRLDPDYDAMLRKQWQEHDSKLYKKAIVISQTIKHFNYLKRENALYVNIPP